MLDSQGLSGWLANDTRVLDSVAVAQASQADIVTSAITVIEVSHARTDTRRLDWLLSRVRVEPEWPCLLSSQAATARAIESYVSTWVSAVDWLTTRARS